MFQPETEFLFVLLLRNVTNILFLTTNSDDQKNEREHGDTLSMDY